MVDYTKTTGNQTLDSALGCGIPLLIAGFLIWVFFFREPDPDRQREVAEYTERQNIREENARLACNSGVQSACVEYAEMID